MNRVFDTATAADRVSKFLNSGDRETASRIELRSRILELLLNAGFSRARFYERCPDVGAAGEDILVLVAEEQRGGDGDGSRMGKCIPVSETGIDLDGSDEDTVFVREAASFNPPPAWIGELGLTDRVWADVNLRVLGKSVGAIAVDWEGATDELKETDSRLLAGIGTMVAQHLQLRPPDRVHRFRSAIGRRRFAEKPPLGNSPVEALLDDSLLAIADILDARMAALFEYRWSTGQINKTREHDTRIGRKHWDPSELLVLSETYQVEENLTGRAWLDPGHRHVPHFSRISDPLRALINRESEQRHTAYMGKAPFTCLYGRIESMEPRYMIRLMNRGGHKQAPYVGERLLLAEILEELRGEVDKATALGRTASLEYATTLASEHDDPTAMLRELELLLRLEDVDNAVVLCHRHQSDQFSFCGIHGDLVSEATRGAFAEWRKDSLYRHLIEHEKIEYIDRYAIKRHGSGSPLAQQLYTKVSGMVVVRLAAGDTRGVMLVPLKPGLMVSRRSLYEYCGVNRLSLLKAYGSLLVDVVNSSVARARADGARRALGVLGHELATPLSRLGGVAESALNEIRRTVIEVERHRDAGEEEAALESMDHIRSAAVGYRGQIQKERRSMGTAMSLAPLVAQESDDGRLELQMESCDLGELVLRAISQCRQEARDQAWRLRGKRKRAPSYNFERTDKVAELGAVVGDAGLLYLAILNVLRNAYKYSIPSPRSNTCEISVSAQRQTGMKIIVVENIGRPLDHDAIDQIFEPWVRLDDDRDSTARTGMGIGLFFSRRLAAAHKGTVLCTGSEPYVERKGPSREGSTADKKLDRMLEGARISTRREMPLGLTGEDAGAPSARYRTTFEIRIADSMPEGAYVHEWGPGHAQAKTRRRHSGTHRGSSG